MTDIVLTHGYFLDEDPKEREIMKPYPPLGLLYLSAYLKREGFSVEVFDTTFVTKADLTARLAATPGGTLGVYTNLMTRGNVVWVLNEARAHGWTVEAWIASSRLLTEVCLKPSRANSSSRCSASA